MQIEVRELWNNCLNIIKNDISEQSFATWFAPIVPLKFQNNTLLIQVPSQFFYEWLEEKHVSDLRKAIDLTIGRHGMLEYSIVVDNGDRKNPPITFNLPPTNQTQNQQAKAPNFPNPAKSPFELKNLDSLELDSYLIPKYTFDKFIEGDCNRLGRAAGMAVAQLGRRECQQGVAVTIDHGGAQGGNFCFQLLCFLCVAIGVTGAGQACTQKSQ